MGISKKTLILAIGATAASISCAQNFPNTLELGHSSVDLLRVRAGALGIPLKHSNVLAGTLDLTLGARHLRQGTDYTADLEAGLVYLLVKASEGDVLSATYRYTGDGKTASSGGGLKMNFGSGSNLLKLGLGVAERDANGSVYTSNVFGLGNQFKLGSNVRMKSLLFHSQRSNESDFTSNQTLGGQFLSQGISANLGGGEIGLNYQSVGRNFTGFGQLKSEDLDGRDLSTLRRQIGFTTTQFAAKNIQLFGLKFSGDKKNIADGSSRLQWDSLNVEKGGLKLGYSTRKSSQSFGRYGDLFEQDRDQLQRESGLTFSKFTFGTSNLQGEQYRVGNGDQAINRSSVQLKFGGSLFEAKTQKVDAGFGRFSSLRDAESGQWAREAGLERNSLSFSNGNKFSVSRLNLSDVGGKSNHSDIHLQNKGLSFDQFVLNSDSGFRSLGNLTAEETDLLSSRYASIIGPAGSYNPGMRGQFAGASGLDRKWSRLAFSGSRFGVETTFGQVSQGESAVTASSWAVTGSNFSAKWGSQSSDVGFNRFNNLMEFERQKLGTLAGVNTHNISASFTPTGKSFNFSSLDASAGSEKAMRHALSFSTGALKLSTNRRAVSAGFSGAGQLVDPEAGMLAQLVGRNQSDTSVSFAPNNKFAFSSNFQSNQAASGTQGQTSSDLRLLWALNPKLGLDLQSRRFVNQFDANRADEINSDRFGLNFTGTKLGTFSFGGEVTSQGGQGSTLSSYRRFNGGWGLNFGKTSFSASGDAFYYNDGNFEKAFVGTLSHQLSNRMGLSVTHNFTDKVEDQSDRTHRDLGFWYDFGGGVKLNFGSSRDLAGGAAGSYRQDWGLTGGNIGALAIGPSRYQEARQDGLNTGATSGWSLSSNRKLRIGPISNLNFFVRGDAQTQSKSLQAENRGYGFSGNLGKLLLSSDYRSQIEVSNQQRWISRGFQAAYETQALTAKFDYRLRTGSNGYSALTRNYQISARLGNGFSLSNQMVTLPEQANGGILLGSQIQDFRNNEWKLNWSGPKFEISGTYLERFQNKWLTRTSGLTFNLEKMAHAPLSFFYGMEQGSTGSTRMGGQRFSFAWTPKPSYKQAFNISVSNFSRVGVVPNPGNPLGLNLNLEYSLRF